MADKEKIEKLEKEIKLLEKQYEQKSLEAMFDRSQQDTIYKKLKKKRKELEQLKKGK